MRTAKDRVASFVRNNQPEVVAAAIAALGGMGYIGAFHARTIGDQLEHPNSSVQVAACKALRNLGEVAEDFTLKLAQKIREAHQAPCVRAAAIAALREDCEQVITGCLDDREAEVRAAACEKLGELGTVSEKHVTTMLQDSATSLSALKALASLGQKAHVSCLNDVVDKGLKSEDPACREQAVIVIGNLQEAALDEPTFGKILDCRNNPNVGVRIALGLALAAMGEAVVAMRDEAAGGASTPLGSLETLLMDADEDRSRLSLVVGTSARRAPAHHRKPKCAAIYAIGRMRGLWSLKSASVESWLSDADWEVRLCTLEMLSSFRKVSGRKGGDLTVDRLKSVVADLLNDSAYPVRAKAIMCFGTWSCEDYCDDIVVALKDSAPDVREAAATALSMLGDAAQDYCHEVFKLFNDKSAACRATAIRCLASMGELGQNYAPVIATMMNEEDVGVRVAAIEALGSMGACGAPFLEDIGDHLFLGAPAERSAAKIAMAKLGFVPAEANAPTQVSEEKPTLYASILAAERAKMGLKR
jgi:HEAT repeat protein